MIELYGSNPNHTIIFTEPDFPFLQALAPFHPLNMKVVYCPIETSLNFQQANKMIRDLKPEVLVVPKVYMNAPSIAPHRDDLVIDRQIVRKCLIQLFVAKFYILLLIFTGETNYHLQMWRMHQITSQKEEISSFP